MTRAWATARLAALVAVGGLGWSSAFGQGAAPAPAKDWSLTLDGTFNSKYVWRGLNLVDDPVFQPSVAFSWKGLTVSIWGNMDLTDVNDEEDHFTEIDYTIDYSWTWEKLKFSLGISCYDYPHTFLPSTTEVYAGIGLDVPLSPMLKVYRDIDEADGTYANFSLSHTFQNVWRPTETVSMSIDCCGCVGCGSSNHNKYYYGTDESGFADWGASLGLPVKIGERWRIRPSVNYSKLIDNDIRENLAKPSNWWTGLSVTFSF